MAAKIDVIYGIRKYANLILEKQKEEINQKNILITDSIDYAKTIQEAILPDDEKLASHLSDYFILYKPKAIVSGVDIAVISTNAVLQRLQYAGAKNALYLVSQNILTEIKADKYSTGTILKDNSTFTYTNRVCNINKGDVIYLFSDGFPDQKGGPDKKKFFYPPVKELLISISGLPMEEQRQKLDDIITNWIGGAEQIDDILIMGIRCI